MIHALLVMAAEVAHEEEETSKAAFYIAAGLLAGWAVVLSALGMQRENWPADAGPQRAVIGITAILVAATMASAVATG